MKKNMYAAWCCVLAAAVIFVDRFTKQWALHTIINTIFINQFLSFDLLFNRGVTAGLLQSNNAVWFAVLSGVIASIIVGLGIYTYFRWRDNHRIVGEVITFAGAVSNLYDRFVFDGVVDFIRLSWGTYSFPVFNIADVCIVVGVAIIFFSHESL